MIVRCHTSILMALECTYKKNVSRKVSEREKWNVRSQKESFLRNWQLDGEGEKKKALISTHLQDLSLLIETK